MKRFLAYEAYVAYHEIVHEEASSTLRIIPTWSTYERGVEALSGSVNALSQKDVCVRKGMTLSDLGIKVSTMSTEVLEYSDIRSHSRSSASANTRSSFRTSASTPQHATTRSYTPSSRRCCLGSRRLRKRSTLPWTTRRLGI